MYTEAMSAVSDATGFVDEANLTVGDDSGPSCNLCGAIMVPNQQHFACLSCGNKQGNLLVAEPDPISPRMAAENINTYGDFVRDMWFSKAVKGQPHYQHNPDLTSLFIMTAGIGGESGELQEKLKKFVRDGTFDRENVVKELGDIAYYWARIATYFGITPYEVIFENVSKLQSRLQRGVLQGSGDNR